MAVCVGCIVSGYMVDRIGAGVTLVLWSALLGSMAEEKEDNLKRSWIDTMMIFPRR